MYPVKIFHPRKQTLKMEPIMKMRTGFFLLIFMGLSLLVSAVATAAPPMPFELLGAVTDEHGNNVPDGTPITCHVNGVTFQTETFTDAGKSYFYCQLLGDDADTADVVEGGIGGSLISVQYNGLEVGRAEWQQGGSLYDLAIQINLNGNPTQPTPTPSPTPSPTPVVTPTYTPPPPNGRVQAELHVVTDMFTQQTHKAVLFLKHVQPAQIYGVNALCDMTAQGIVEFTAVNFSPLFDEGALMAKNSIRANKSEWEGAISQTNPAPTLQTDGALAEFDLKAVNGGTVGISCSIRLVNRDGFDIDTLTINRFVSVTTPQIGSLSGTATYQTRNEHSGIKITLDDPLKLRQTTLASGLFTFPGLSAGDYQLRAWAQGFLAHCEDVTMGQQGLLIDRPIRLLAGDVDSNGEVNILDAISITSIFNSTHNSYYVTDFNQDRRVDIGDLTALGGNFGKTSNCN